MIESTESSNRLEGITISQQRLQDLVQHNSKPLERAEQEIAGYRDALALIHESYPAMGLNKNLILQLHQVLFCYHPAPGGHWKATDNEIVDISTDGSKKVRFKAVAAILTEPTVVGLIDSYHHSIDQGVEPLLVIPVFILDFLCIHPFSDGNGRIARLLTFLLLYQQGYHVGSLISLERLFESTKTSYYDTLFQCSQGWHKNNHLTLPWVEYFWGILLQAYRELDDKLSTPTGKGWKKKRVLAFVLKETGQFSFKEIVSALSEVSPHLIRKVLNELHQEQKIFSEGKGRGACWRVRASFNDGSHLAR